VILVLIAGVILAFRYAMTKAQYSDLARILTYQLGLNILHSKPLLGVGLGNTLAAYDSYGIGFAAMIGSKLVIHNALLGIAAEIGIFGALCYLVFMAVPGVILFRRVLRYSKRFYPYVEISAFNVLTAIFMADMFLPYELLFDSFWMYLTFPFIVLQSRNENDRLMLGIMFSEARAIRPPAEAATDGTVGG
jgi:O-antigen ligase